MPKADFVAILYLLALQTELTKPKWTYLLYYEHDSAKPALQPKPSKQIKPYSYVAGIISLKKLYLVLVGLVV